MDNCSAYYSSIDSATDNFCVGRAKVRRYCGLQATAGLDMLVQRRVSQRRLRVRSGLHQKFTLADGDFMRSACWLLAVLCIVFSVPSDGSAEELYASPASQCDGTIGGWMSGLSSSREIFVYFENDMTAEYLACSGETGYQEYELQAEVEAALETWNQEATGVTFHIEGTVPTGTTSVACSSRSGGCLLSEFRQRPYRFRESENGAWSHCSRGPL